MVLIFDQDRATVSGPSPVYVSFHVVCNRTLTRGSKIKRSDSRFIRLSTCISRRDWERWSDWRRTASDCRVPSPPSVRLQKSLIVRTRQLFFTEPVARYATWRASRDIHRATFRSPNL